MEATEICELFGLGRPLAEPRVAAAGWGERNLVWRIDTDAGAFAVKDLVSDLLPQDPDDVTRIEATAHNHGVSCPAPVRSVDGSYFVPHGTRWLRCHHWAEGAAKMNEDTSTSDAFGMGQLVAGLHRLELPAVHELPSNVFGRDHWLELARSRPDAQWGLRLTANVDRILAAEKLGASFDPPAAIASHRDLNAHNVLFSSSGPVLIDWDGAGTISAVFERASTPVLWAQRHDGDLDPTIATAFVRGYKDGGGEIDEDDITSLSMSLSGLSWWTERNVRIAVSQPSAHHDELAGWLVDALIQGTDDVAARQRFLANIISTA